MIGQYLPNNNENATVPILQKKIVSKPGLPISTQNVVPGRAPNAIPEKFSKYARQHYTVLIPLTDTDVH
jgi:hypothetical protein